MMKWALIILIGALTVMFCFGGLATADNGQDDQTTIKKSTTQTESKDTGVIAKTKNVLGKAAGKTDQAVRKAFNKTGNFFKRIGEKTRKWFKG